MAARVTDEEVRNILGDPEFDTQAAITTANLLVNEQLVGKGLSTGMLKQIELYLAAHFAQVSYTDGALASQELGEARERYHDIYGPGLQSTRFGQQAILLDVTGTLATISAAAATPRLPALFSVVGTNPADEDLDSDLII